MQSPLANIYCVSESSSQNADFRIRWKSTANLAKALAKLCWKSGAATTDQKRISFCEIHRWDDRVNNRFCKSRSRSPCKWLAIKNAHEVYSLIPTLDRQIAAQRKWNNRPYKRTQALSHTAYELDITVLGNNWNTLVGQLTTSKRRLRDQCGLDYGNSDIVY